MFTAVVRKASFGGAATELGTSPAYVSKRIRLLEQDLQVKLLHRTTRRVAVTEEGERVFHWAQRILDDMEQLMQEVAVTRSEPRGLLRVSSSFGFGRQIVAPALSRLVEQHPGLQVRLEVFDRLVDVAGEGFDLDVRVGDEIAPHLIARRLADNHRVLCAAPSYSQRKGTPRTVADLSAHDCLVIKERDHPFGVWRLRSGAQEESVKVRGPLSANNGEMAVQWAVDGVALCFARCGMWARTCRRGAWCRCCRSGSKWPMCGPCTPRGWSARPRCGCAWSFCRCISAPGGRCGAQRLERV